ncbi:Uncharacterized protein MCB1EB_0816 [Mycoavidus cysteinexigens]|uniref:Uncharacterized protein n=1 Tax=Mycoavidus cysteinexigens TaxID=1553431 RepID=A0A2Z6EU51_9BURK|nr:cytosolic protein [Mycoavidus cysteinexigens]BBE08977.1 Uncharacterized protein MCB1EB_0816 [Mycoavidus cysteinexigens]GLR01178.1 hypothetical protein GCM10007934_09900 [Mycoavidus cysteinexigens]
MTAQLANPPFHADAAWKNALNAYFPEFMQFFYQELAQKIAWEAKYEMLDQELQRFTEKSQIGKRLVDKLIKVRLKNGVECYLLLHIEVQGNYETGFAQRLFEYFYRLHERYGQWALTLVILADDRTGWRPQDFSIQACGYQVNRFQFLTSKLLDYRGQEKGLLAQANPFGMMVAAHLAALQTRTDPNARYRHKYRLTRFLYEKGMARESILNLYRFIDAVLTLPKEFEIIYNSSIKQLEKESEMEYEYITSAERIGMEQGLKEGVKEGLEKGRQENRQILSNLLIAQLQCKFKNLAEPYLQKLNEADVDTLRQWGERIFMAQTLDEVF